MTSKQRVLPPPRAGGRIGRRRPCDAPRRRGRHCGNICTWKRTTTCWTRSTSICVGLPCPSLVQENARPYPWAAKARIFGAVTFARSRTRSTPTSSSTTSRWPGSRRSKTFTIIAGQASTGGTMRRFHPPSRRLTARNRANHVFRRRGLRDALVHARARRFLIDLHEQPEIATAICEHVEEYYRQRALRVLEAAGGQVDIIGSGGDIGSERGIMLNPRSGGNASNRSLVGSSRPSGRWASRRSTIPAARSCR